MSIMPSTGRASLLTELRENPIFLRDMAVGAGWRKRLSGLSGFCFRMGVLWLLVMIGVVAAKLFAPEDGMSRTVSHLVPTLAQIFVSPLVHFPLGYYYSYRRFRDARSTGFFRDMYFTRLGSPEILRGKLAALLLPALLLQAWVLLSFALYTMIFGSPMADQFQLPLPSTMFGHFFQLFFVGIALVYQVAAGALGLFGGVLGGMQMAMLGRPGNWMGNIFLHLVLAFTIMCCCMFMALIYLPGYQRIRNEFWWHAVYLDQEDISRGGRMEG
jgi:hypothetical protein